MKSWKYMKKYLGIMKSWKCMKWKRLKQILLRGLALPASDSNKSKK